MAGRLASVWRRVKELDRAWQLDPWDAPLEVRISGRARRHALASGGRLFLWCDGDGLAHATPDAPDGFDCASRLLVRGVEVELGTGAGWFGRVLIGRVPVAGRYTVITPGSMGGASSAGGDS